MGSLTLLPGIQIAAAAKLVLSGSGALTSLGLFSVLYYLGEGSLAFESAWGVLGAQDTACGTVAGALHPGTLTLALTSPLYDGGPTGTHTRPRTLGVGQVWSSAAHGLKNCKGKAVLLVALPARTWTDDAAGGRAYVAACTAAGLRPLKSGYSSYCDQKYSYQGNVLNIPTAADGAGGSTSDVDSWYRGTDPKSPHWSSFLMFQYNNAASNPLYGRTLAHDNLDNSALYVPNEPHLRHGVVSCRCRRGQDG